MGDANAMAAQPALDPIETMAFEVGSLMFRRQAALASGVCLTRQ
jgi:hypothetical protein